MKKLTVICCIFLLLCTTLSGCFFLIPSIRTESQPKTFEADGIRLVLTDAFQETESERGFFAYYTSQDCGVTVTKEAFSQEAGMDQLPLEEYIRNVIRNNGHQNIQPQNRDGLWYYVVDKDNTCIHAYCYKGPDAFFIVQFICMRSDAETMAETFHQWALQVEVFPSQNSQRPHPMRMWSI